MRDASYVSDPFDVELLPGAAEAIARLNERGICVIVVTNQSGIARGWMNNDDYIRVRGKLDALLAAEGRPATDRDGHAGYDGAWTVVRHCREARLSGPAVSRRGRRWLAPRSPLAASRR